MASHGNRDCAGNNGRNCGGSVNMGRDNGYGGGVSLNDNSNSDNFQQQRRQTCRGGSNQDSRNWRGGPGFTGAASSCPSNKVSAHSSGPVQPAGMSEAQIASYAAPVFDSPERVHRGRGLSTTQDPGVSSAVAAVSSSSAVQAMLAVGPVNVFIAAERELANPNPSRPAFLHGFVFGPATHADWYNIVLGYVSTLTFTVDSTTDLHYFADMLASSQNPMLYQSITKIAFPGMYWFTGVQHNRRHNPVFEMTNTLPCLEQVSLRLHTAGITVSCYGERQMLAIEAVDPQRSKERKVMSLQEVVGKYELDALFSCRRLRRVRIEYVDCEMTAFFTKVGRAVDVLRDIQAFIINGFAGQGLNVFVELVRVNG